MNFRKSFAISLECSYVNKVSVYRSCYKSLNIGDRCESVHWKRKKLLNSK